MCAPNEAWHLETPWPWGLDAHGSCHMLRHTCRWLSTACETCLQEVLTYQLAGPQWDLNHTQELYYTCYPQLRGRAGSSQANLAGQRSVPSPTRMV